MSPTPAINIDTRLQQGIRAFEAGRYEDALACFSSIVDIDPTHDGALNNRAAALAQLGRLDEALECLQRVLAIAPDHADALSNSAYIHSHFNRHEAALACLDRALAINPNQAAAWNNRGSVLGRLDRIGEALVCYETALAMNPEYAEARYNRAAIQLSLGNLRDGFAGFEARWDMRPLKSATLKTSAPRWRGNAAPFALKGKTLLIWHEQGLGDTLQFVRYATLAAHHGARVILRAPSALLPLLKTVPGVSAVVSEAEPLPPHDGHCPMMSLPAAFGTALQTIPVAIPYLSADPGRVAYWQSQLGPRARPRIGLVWAGRQYAPINHARDMTLAVLQPLFELDAEFVSLQKEIPDADRALLANLPAVKRYGETLGNWDDTAALVKSLDLIVAVDTSMAHLAGALGKPVWILNRYAGCWRWLRDRSDSPWYPTARLFKQRTSGDWAGVVAEVKAALQDYLATDAAHLQASHIAVEKSADAQFALGLQQHQTQNYDAAERHYRRALAIDPDRADVYSNLGVLLATVHRYDEAEDSYRKALALNPRHADALNNLGVLLAASDRRDEAERCYRKALALRPEYADLHNNLGGILTAQGHDAEAEACYRTALTLRPGYADAHCNLAGLLIKGKRFAEAADALRAALAIRAGDAEAYNTLGAVLAECKRYDDAETCYRQALSLRPEFPEAHNNLGIVLAARDRHDEAERYYRNALALRPDYADAYSNLGGLLTTKRRFTEAVPLFQRALALRPDHADTWISLGITMALWGRFDEAETCQRRALALSPNNVKAQRQLSYALLCLGQFEEGWPLYEARCDPELDPNSALPSLPFPQWHGESLVGKSLLIWYEQGFGDQIQFCRYVPLLKARGAARVSLICSRRTQVSLFETLDGVDAVYCAEGNARCPVHDYWGLPLSIPLHCKTTLETIPATLPYLRACPERMQRWRQRLPDPGFKIGLVWKGNPKHSNDANRSLPDLRTLAPLWRARPDAVFVSLQKGAGEDEALRPPSDQPLIHLGTDIEDFADTAAILAQLDLLICVDTAVAHLAGALNKPCWILVPGIGMDWRWMLGRDDSPWYPGVMRLFRQAADESWGRVIQALAQALATSVGIDAQLGRTRYESASCLGCRPY
jgi:tetratricopeptide (TPR) repeat protein